MFLFQGTPILIITLTSAYQARAVIPSFSFATSLVVANTLGTITYLGQLSGDLLSSSITSFVTPHF